MAKKKIGILERTAAEQVVLTPEEKHAQVSNLIPMQAPESFHWVRLRNVVKRTEQGWQFKQQTKLQGLKVQLVFQIHNALRADQISTIRASKLVRLLDEATVKTIAAFKKELEAVLAPAEMAKAS